MGAHNQYKIILALCSILLMSGCTDSSTPVQEKGNSEGSISQDAASPEALVTGLDTPWSIDFLPDGKMIFTERHGKISIYDGKNVRAAGRIDVDETGESGLLGLAVDPGFINTRYVFVYLTNRSENKVVRYTLENSMLSGEKDILTWIPKARFHDGGRIKFGPDGMLYVTTGDALEPSSAQDINSLAGKILRLGKDGKVPEGNLLGNYVYSYGHRNSQGLAWNPETGKMYASEHGPSANDEVNLIREGKNYGWPDVQCIASGETEGIVQPLRCFSEFTLAPSGMAFYDNALYVAGLRGAQIRKIVLSADGESVFHDEEFITGYGRIREIVVRNGWLYFATSNRDGRGVPRIGDDKIVRIKIK